MRVFRGKAVTISCTDQQRSVAFYRDVLGAIPLPGDGYGCPRFRLGDLIFSLAANAATTTPALFPRHAMTLLCLEVDDLRAAHRRLTEAAVAIVDAPADGPYLTIADPDGLLIEVWERNPDAALPP